MGYSAPTPLADLILSFGCWGSCGDVVVCLYEAVRRQTRYSKKFASGHQDAEFPTARQLVWNYQGCRVSLPGLLLGLWFRV